MDTLQRSDTVLFQTINSVLSQLEYKLSFYKIGFFILLILIILITFWYLYTLWTINGRRPIRPLVA